MHILLVDDMPANQRVAKLLLTRLGCEVEIANNGQEAVARFESDDFDFILMDLQMPEVDGFEATRRIREIEARSGVERTPIIAFTANTMEDDRRRCSETGMDDFIAKPIRRDIFESLLERVRDKRLSIS